MTLNYVESLRKSVVTMTERATHLEKMINDSRSKYKNMTPAQLNEAVRDNAGMRREIGELRKHCKKAKKEIALFYAPASA